MPISDELAAPQGSQRGSGRHDPSTSDVIDAALSHLIESETIIQEARDEHPVHVIQSIANTSVISLRYRTRVESRWR